MSRPGSARSSESGPLTSDIFPKECAIISLSRGFDSTSSVRPQMSGRGGALILKVKLGTGCYLRGEANRKKQRPIKANFIWCKWLHISFSRSSVDYYNFNFLAPWESRDFLASHVPAQNEIFLPPRGHLDYKMSCLCTWNERFFFFLIIK